MLRKFFALALIILIWAPPSLAVPAETTGHPHIDRGLRKWANSMNRYFQTGAVIRFDTTPYINAMSMPTGEVTLFYGLIDNALKGNAEWTYLIFVMAHEWGHQLQHIDYGSRYRFSVQNELQADCLGAYFMFTHLDADRQQLNQLIYGHLPTTSDSAWTPWWSPTAHGTAQQRIASINRGWVLASHRFWMGRLYAPWELYQACLH